MNTEKVLAAMDVSDSGVLTGLNKYSDIQRVKAILPDHYEIKEGLKGDYIDCKSNIGIRKAPYKIIVEGKVLTVTDAEDEEHWGYIMKAFKNYFGSRFKEVYHNVWFCHTDFTIYFKP